MSRISKKDIEHLAALARLKLDPDEEQKLEKDLGNILGYFEELKEVNTDNVQPMTGGTVLRSVLREDEANRTDDNGKGVNDLPNIRDGYLKLPNVFD